jgi:hypothetical protein
MLISYYDLSGSNYADEKQVRCQLSFIKAQFF